MSGSHATGLAPLFLAEFTLCNVHDGEPSVVLTDSMSSPDFAAAAMQALIELEAAPIQINLPDLPSNSFTPSDGGSGGWGKLELAMTAMKAAGIVIDLTAGGLLYTGALKTLLDGGTRVLRVRGGEGALRRLFPCEEVVKRARTGAEALTAARQIRMVSPAGTDLRMDKTGRVAIAQYGMAEAPGRWDNWGTGGVLSTGLEQSTEGVLVIDEGDIILPFGRYAMGRIRCHYEAGRIRAIEGGLDAELLRDYFDMWNDETVTEVGHIGWGVEHRSRWVNLAVNDAVDRIADARFFYGNVQLGLGRNFGIGGKNTCTPHTDIVFRHCDFYLDGEQVVADGRILPPELQ